MEGASYHKNSAFSNGSIVILDRDRSGWDPAGESAAGDVTERDRESARAIAEFVVHEIHLERLFGVARRKRQAAGFRNVMSAISSSAVEVR